MRQRRCTAGSERMKVEDLIQKHTKLQVLKNLRYFHQIPQKFQIFENGRKLSALSSRKEKLVSLEVVSSVLVS